MSSLAERSFIGGELTPAQWANVTLAKYQEGLRTARNGFIMRQGGFTNRPGTAMIATTKTASLKVRLLPFVFSNSVAYVLELGNQYMRVYRAGTQIAAGTVTAWSNSTSYVPGSLVSLSGTNYYCVAANINQSPPNATYWYAMPASVYEMPTPYLTADLPNIQFVQSENVMYIACAGYPVEKLTCLSDTDWTLSPLNYTPTVVEASPPNGNPANGDPSPWIQYSFVAGYDQRASSSSGPGIIYGQPAIYAGLLGSYSGPYLGSGQKVTPGAGGFPGAPQLVIEDYMITAVNLVTGIESLPMPGARANIEGIGADPPYYTLMQSAPNEQVVTAVGLTNPFSVTVASTADFKTDDLFTFKNTGIQQLDGQTAVGLVTSATTVAFIGIDGTGFTPSLSGSSKIACLVSRVTAVPHATSFTDPYYGSTGWYSSGPLDLFWDAPLVSGSYVYNVYKRATSGLWGFMALVTPGVSAPYQYRDDGTTSPDTSKAPPVFHNNFLGAGGSPGVIGVYQQRLILANTPGQQEDVWASNVGNFEDFTSSTPSVDSDTINFQISGKKFNPVTQVIDNGFLLIFTESGEFSCLGDASGALTPTGINLRQQAFYGGSNILSPISVGKNVLYLQSRQSKVRELLYNYYINGYSGTDITVFSNHLFDGHTFLDWTYAQEPNSLIWMVRDDGTLLSLTYMPEQQLVAWTRHDTMGRVGVQQGFFENVCAIPEGGEDALYCVVNRPDNFGNLARFVERFASRFMPLVPTMEYLGGDTQEDGQVTTTLQPDVARSVFMDCSTFYDGRNTTSIFMEAVSGDLTANGAGFVMRASSSYFNSGMVGKAIMVTDNATGKVYRCKILTYTDTLNVTCRPDVTFPASLPLFTAFHTWALGIKVITGLDYLDFCPVSVLADGAVISSPSSANTTLTVASGSITLPNYYAYVRVGLPYFTDLQTLDIDTPQQGQTAQDKKMFTGKLGLFVQQTRGVWGGSTPPPDDLVNPLEGLAEYSARDRESMGTTPDTKTGIILETINGKWAFGGSVFVRQVDPLPLTVLSVVPAGLYALGG